MVSLRIVKRCCKVLIQNKRRLVMVLEIVVPYRYKEKSGNYEGK